MRPHTLAAVAAAAITGILSLPGSVSAQPVVDEEGTPIADREGAMAKALPATAPGAAAAATLTYRVTLEEQGSVWGEWLVTQGEDLALARWAGDEGSEGPGEVALVAGPAVGGLPAEPKHDHGGLLGTLFDPAAGFGPGFWKSSSYGSGTAVVDSLRIELREGEANEAIAGHDTRHHVLTARLWWRHVAEEGWETAVFETGTADLWLAPDLPFSWLPFAVHPATPGLAFPLARTWPEVAWVAIAEHATWQGPQAWHTPRRRRGRDRIRRWSPFREESCRADACHSLRLSRRCSPRVGEPMTDE